MRKRLWSIFTDDLNKCIITGRTDHIERHHVFGSFNRKRSEKYGFIVPLHAEIHPNGAFCTAENWKEVDFWMKAECQAYYLKHYGDRDSWYAEFGRFYEVDDEGQD